MMILVIIYIFVPYVAETLIGGSVRGQETFSRWNTYASIFIMLTAPVLGASVDCFGRRKAWLAVIVAAMSSIGFALWWAVPNGAGMSVPMVLLLLLLMLNILFPYSEVLHNSLLVRAAGRGGAHRASGLALALGNAFGVAALTWTAWAFALPGHVSWWWVPPAPLFGLDPAAHAPERIVGPLSAAIFLLWSLPLFLFTPDAAATGVSARRAFVEGIKALWLMLQTVKQYRPAATFLLARLFYIDGTTAILLYGGLYLRGVMKWSPLELLVYGILASTVAIGGAFLGRWLDGRIGPKRAVQVELLLLLIGVVAYTGNNPDTILYIWHPDPDFVPHSPLWRGPIFRTLPDVAMALTGLFIAIFITANYASSRTLLTRLTPPDQSGAFFGLFALSGTATLWLGNLLVNLGTRVFQSQQGGFAIITIMLAAGFIGLLFVHEVAVSD